MMVRLALQAGDSPILVNPDQIASVTVDLNGSEVRGSHVHMAITGHVWNVRETQDKILDLIAGAAEGLWPAPVTPPPKPLGR